MYCKEIYVMAYERIKSKAGNMTAGTNEETLDGFSTEWIEQTIELMKSQKYKFNPARATFIPKKNGKTRKLSVASPRDKVVQEVIRSILEAIYEPIFSDNSHGFRAARGCHSALKQVRYYWSGACWIIEGDIKGCFDNIPHQKLLNVIKEKIKDEKFLNLIGKALKAGWIENNQFVNSKIGTPQGSVLSPLLANIYLDKFDRFVAEIIKSNEKGKNKRINPEYKRIVHKYNNVSAKIKHAEEDMTRQRLIKEYKVLKKSALKLPSALSNDEKYIRVKYIRYADDWMIGINGPLNLAEKIKKQCAEYLEKELGLELSWEKTHIRQAKKEFSHFLGVNINIGNYQQKILKISSRNSDKKFTRRTTGWTPNMLAPIDEIVSRLYKKGICNKLGYPTSKKLWVAWDDSQILLQYSAMNRGILNYYSFVDNYSKLSRIQYILQYSAAMTLAHKHKTQMTKIFKERGRNLTTKINKDGKVIKISKLYLNHNWKVDRDRFNGTTKEFNWDVHITHRTATRLYDFCAICGTSEKIHMHHIKHIRKIGEKVQGFTKLMAIINRKQVPVCEWCHQEIHAGRYDGLKLAILREGMNLPSNGT
jgi:group II intron reverse transcriptase/maturase